MNRARKRAEAKKEQKVEKTEEVKTSSSLLHKIVVLLLVLGMIGMFVVLPIIAVRG